MHRTDQDQPTKINALELLRQFEGDFVLIYHFGALKGERVFLNSVEYDPAQGILLYGTFSARPCGDPLPLRQATVVTASPPPTSPKLGCIDHGKPPRLNTDDYTLELLCSKSLSRGLATKTLRYLSFEHPNPTVRSMATWVLGDRLRHYGPAPVPWTAERFRVQDLPGLLFSQV